MRECPFAALHLLFLRHPDLEQVADGRRKDVAVAFEVIAMTHESAERARNVGGDGRFLGDDQRFRHGGGCEERQIVPKSMRREQINLRLKQANARTYARARSRTHASATTGLPLFLRPLLP